MRLANVLSSLAFAAVASAAIAVVPTNGDGVVIEHRDVSARGQEHQVPPSDAHGDRYKTQGYPSKAVRQHNTEVLNRVGHRFKALFSDLDDIYEDFIYSWQFEDDSGHHGSVSSLNPGQIHMLIQAAHAKTQDLLQDTVECIWNAEAEDNEVITYHSVTGCIRQYIPWDDPVGDRAVKREETVIAPPEGTTTIYTTATIPTATVTGAVISDRPDELLATHIGGTYGVLTTNIVETQHVTTTTTPGIASASVTTLTDPINPTVTSIRTLGVPTSIINNTSIDTHSYIDISTFSAKGLPTPATTSSLSVDSSLMSQMSSEMSSAMSSVLSSTTVDLSGGNTAIAGAGAHTASLPTGTSTVGSGSAKSIDDDLVVTYLAMLSSAGLFFVFAWFL